MLNLKGMLYSVKLHVQRTTLSLTSSKEMCIDSADFHGFGVITVKRININYINVFCMFLLYRFLFKSSLLND